METETPSKQQPRFRKPNQTKAARRRRALAAAFLDALGGEGLVSAVQMIDVKRAAELVALSEETRARALCGGPTSFDMTNLVRLEGAADRAVRRLGIKPAEGQTKPTLQDYLASRTARPADASSGEAA